MADGPRLLVAAALAKIIEPILRQSFSDATVRIAEGRAAVEDAVGGRLRFDVVIADLTWNDYAVEYAFDGLDVPGILRASRRQRRDSGGSGGRGRQGLHGGRRGGPQAGRAVGAVRRVDIGQLMASTTVMLEESSLASQQQKSAADQAASAIQQIREAAGQLAAEQAQWSATTGRLETLTGELDTALRAGHQQDNPRYS